MKSDVLATWVGIDAKISAKAIKTQTNCNAGSLGSTLKMIAVLYQSKMERDKEADAQVLQCVAVCCSELQCVAVCYSVLECVCSAVRYTENNFNIVFKQSGEG